MDNNENEEETRPTGNVPLVPAPQGAPDSLIEKMKRALNPKTKKDTPKGSK